MRYLVAGVLIVVAALTLTEAQTVRAALQRLGAGWSRLHPEVKRRAVRVLEDANAELARQGDPWRFAIFEGWRDVETQRAAIAAGTSKLRDPLNGWHVWGLAVDMVLLDTAGKWRWPDVSDPRWQILGDAYRRHGFTWGRDWDGDGRIGEAGEFDAPHGELRSLNVTPAQLRGRYQDNPLAYVASFEAVA